MNAKKLTILAAVLAAFVFPATASTVKFHKNAIKYKDAGKKHASGRSGSATVQARALVNRDHTADLQLTTGSFDPAASRGNIDKVQIKSQSTGTINDNRLRNDGTYSINLKGVDRGQPVEVHAHVSGIDGRKTDVVKLTETAKLRPDLSVTALSVAPTVVTGLPAIIDAAVRELNGDVGARANCQLRVNGTVVDSAEGIWVDAAGTVSCSFRYIFRTVGTARVEVALANVQPGDYDSGNNILRKDVTVANDAIGMQRWSAGSEELESTYDYVTEASWGYHMDMHQSGWTNFTAFDAIWSENLDLATLKVSYVEKTDGTAVIDLRNMPLKRDDTAFQGSGGGQCMVGLTELMTVSVCQRAARTGQPWEQRPAFINPRFLRRAGDVTYISHEWGKPDPNMPDGTYIKNEHTRTKTGKQVRLGSTVSLEVEVSDATRRYAERPTYTLRSERRDFDDPWRCWNNYWCGEAHYRSTLKWGRATSPGY